MIYKTDTNLSNAELRRLFDKNSHIMSIETPLKIAFRSDFRPSTFINRTLDKAEVLEIFHTDEYLKYIETPYGNWDRIKLDHDLSLLCNYCTEKATDEHNGAQMCKDCLEYEYSREEAAINDENDRDKLD